MDPCLAAVGRLQSSVNIPGRRQGTRAVGVSCWNCNNRGREGVGENERESRERREEGYTAQQILLESAGVDGALGWPALFVRFRRGQFRVGHCYPA